MARDLIPPPSPAGRPDPDHESSLGFEPISEEPAEPEPAAALPQSQFHGRFGFITGMLLGCGIAAGVLLLVLLTSGNRTSTDGLARDWSSWHPDTVSTFNGADEIAKHIQSMYRNEKNKPLASVTGGPIAFGTIPLTVAMVPSGDNVQLLNGTGVQYTLGGAGKDGLLRDSKPSKARHRLLRREALELSLYSFRYLPDVTMVVTLMPPAPKVEQVRPTPKGKKAAKAAAKKTLPRYQDQAIFYRPGDLKPQLQVPLKFTLAPKPPAIDNLSGAEARRVDSLTLSNLFEYARQPGQDGRAYLLLTRPS